MFSGKKKHPFERQAAISDGSSVSSPESNMDKKIMNRRSKRSKDTKEKSDLKLEKASRDSSNENIIKEPSAISDNDNLFPVEKVVEYQVENSSNLNLNSNSNVIVKTTRKIFSPVYGHDSKPKSISLSVDDNEETKEPFLKETKDNLTKSELFQTQNSNPEAFAGKIRANTSSPSWMNRVGSPSNSPSLQRRVESKSNNSKGGTPLSPTNQVISTNDKIVQSRMEITDDNSEGCSDKSRKASIDSINFDRSKIKKTKSTLEEKSALPPQSPSSTRKIISKETAPSIRMMIAKYNQKLTEQDGQGDLSGSGSVSPVAWRSPVAERRVLAQSAKYAEDMARSNWPVSRYGIVKSSTTSLIGVGSSTRGATTSTDTSTNSTPISLRKLSQINIPGFNLITSNQTATQAQTPSFLKGILKSPSTSTLKSNISHNQDENNINVNVVKPEKEVIIKSPKVDEQKVDPDESINFIQPSLQTTVDSQLRAIRLQKAKEEFLQRGPPVADLEQTNPGSRLSQISAASLSSYEGDEQSYSQQQLYKSGSAGMIHVDPEAYKFFSNENSDNSPSSSNHRFSLHSLTSRLRKVF